MKLKKYLLLQLMLFGSLCVIVGCERSTDSSDGSSVIQPKQIRAETLSGSLNR